MTISIVCVLATVVAWRSATFVEAQGVRQRLAFDGAFDLRLASNGDIAVLVAQSGRSDLTVFRSVGGGSFVPTEFVVPPDILDRRVSGLWATTHGFFVFQHASRRLLPRLSRSVDGARWETINSPVFDSPADIHDMVQLANGDLLAVGLLRVGEPATGPFRGVMWRSRDGVTWDQVLIVGRPGEESSFESVAAQGPTVIAGGLRSRTPALWRSDDGGTSWVIIDNPAGRPQTVTTTGGRFVRVGMFDLLEFPDLTFATSIDGRSWREGKASGLLADGLRLFPRQSATTSSGVFLVGSTQLDLSRRLDQCYSAPATCTRGSGSLVVLHTTTGDLWRAIDVDSLLGSGFQAFAVADTKAGTVIAGAARGGIEILTVPPASWSFVLREVALPSRQLPPLAKRGDSLKVATLYRLPFNLHCGLEWLGHFNGRTWKLQRQLVGSNPYSVEALPKIQETLLGTVRLTSPDTIEYAIEGVGVVAVYGPTDETAPLCI